MHAVAFLDVDGGELPADLFANFSLGRMTGRGRLMSRHDELQFFLDSKPLNMDDYHRPRRRFQSPNQMIKSADKPKSIHREPHQREDAGKSDFASSQRRPEAIRSTLSSRPSEP